MNQTLPTTNEELLLAAKGGDKKAIDALVENNLGLVHIVVKRFLNRGQEADDLFQIGTIGLMKSIKNFDDSFGVKFSTYAVPMIMGEIKRFLRDDSMIKVSRSIKETAYKVYEATRKLKECLEREPTVNEIARELGIDVEDVVTALDATLTPESLYAPVGSSDGKELLLVDTVSRSECEEEVVNKVMITQMINGLESRERQIILLRYFKGKTQTEVSRLLGISQVQVSRLEKKILQGLKNKMTV